MQPFVSVVLAWSLTLTQTPAPAASAAVKVPATEIAVSGELLLPDSPGALKAAVIVMNWGETVVGPFFRDPRLRDLATTTSSALILLKVEAPAQAELPPEQQVFRNAALGGAEGVFLLLAELARQTSRPELREVPMLFWGFSASGNFGVTFGATHPNRTIGFVRYQSHMRGLEASLDAIRGIPALIVVGAADRTAGIEDSESFWRAGRKHRAPWTFAVDPGKVHGDGIPNATDFLGTWMETVIQVRVRAGKLNALPDTTGLLGEHTKFEFEKADSRAAPDRTSWLPDERTALLWRAVNAGR